MELTELVRQKFDGFPLETIMMIQGLLTLSDVEGYHSIPYIRFKYGVEKAKAENVVWLINYEKLAEYPKMDDIKPEELSIILYEHSARTSLQYLHDLYGGSFKSYIKGYLIEIKYHHEIKKLGVELFNQNITHTIIDDSEYYNILKSIDNGNHHVKEIVNDINMSEAVTYRRLTKMIKTGLVTSETINGNKIVSW